MAEALGTRWGAWGPIGELGDMVGGLGAHWGAWGDVGGIGDTLGGLGTHWGPWGTGTLRTF